MVFGFFLDGQDQQVPVIMGVLGNNSQTELSQIIGDNSVTNAQAGSIAKSGYASGSKSKGNAKEITPDQDKVIKQPRRRGSTSFQAKHPSGSANSTPTSPLIIQTQIIQMTLKRQDQVQKPAPGATLENEAVHQITAGDVKRSDKCDEKIALMKPDPDEVVQSA